MLPSQIFEEFFHLSLDMLCIASTDGYFKLVNPSFERILGWTEDELLSRPFIEFVHPDDVDATLKEIESQAAGVPTLSFENRYRCSDGSYRHLQWIGFRQEETGLIFAVARDTTQLLEASRRIRVAIDASPAAIIMVDSGGSIRLANMEAARLFGYDRDEVLGRPIEMLIPARYHTKHRQFRLGYVENAVRRPMGRGRQLVGIRENGEEFPLEIGLNPIELEDGLHVLGSIVDLTIQRDLEHNLIEASEELRDANDRLSRLATTDELTGLLNRRAFDEQLMVHIRLMQRMVSPLSLLLIDLDHFKELNDEYGHLAGDEALQQVSSLMMQNSRGSDIVARYGGEEFAIILPSTDVNGALKLAEKIRVEILNHSWDRSHLTASIGASTMFFEARELAREAYYGSSLVSDADRALYQSKDRGRNRVTHASRLPEG